MAEACASFTQHAWKKDLCANCMKPRDKHAGPVPSRRAPRGGADRPVFSEVRGVLGARTEVSEVRSVLSSRTEKRSENGTTAVTHTKTVTSTCGKPIISAKPDLLRDATTNESSTQRSPKVDRAPRARISDIELEDEHFRPASKDRDKAKDDNKTEEELAKTDPHYYHKYDVNASLARKGPRGPYLEQVTHKHVPVEDFKVSHEPKDLVKPHPRLSELSDVPVALPYNIVDVSTIPVDVDPSTLDKNPPKVPCSAPERDTITSGGSSTCSTPSISSTLSSWSKKTSPDSCSSPLSSRKLVDSPTSRRHNNNQVKDSTSSTSTLSSTVSSTTSRMIILRNEFFKGFNSPTKESPTKNDNPYEPVAGESDDDNSNSDVSSQTSAQKTATPSTNIDNKSPATNSDMDAPGSGNTTPSKKRKNSNPTVLKEEKKERPKKNGRSFFSRWFGFGGQEEEDDDKSESSVDNLDASESVDAAFENTEKAKQTNGTQDIHDTNNMKEEVTKVETTKDLAVSKISSLEKTPSPKVKEKTVKKDSALKISSPKPIPITKSPSEPENSPSFNMKDHDTSFSLLDEIESMLQIQPTYETGSDLMRISTTGTLGRKSGTLERPKDSPPPEPKKRVTIDESITKVLGTPPQAKKRSSLERQREEKERERDEEAEGTLQREGSGLTSSRKLKRPPREPPPPPAPHERSPPHSPSNKSITSTTSSVTSSVSDLRKDKSASTLSRSNSRSQEVTQRRRLEISAPQLQRTSVNLDVHLTAMPKSESGSLSPGSQSPSDTCGSNGHVNMNENSGSSGDGSVGSFYSVGSDGRPRNTVERRSSRVVRRMNQAPPPPPDGGRKRMSTGDTFCSMPPTSTQTLPRPPKNREDSISSNPDETLLPTKKDKKKDKPARSKTLTEGVKFDLDKFSFSLRSKDKSKVQDRALPEVPKCKDPYVEENNAANHYEMVTYEDVYDDIPEESSKNKGKRSPKKAISGPLNIEPPPIPPMMQTSAEYLEPINKESGNGENSGGSAEVDSKSTTSCDSPKPLVPRHKAHVLQRKPMTKAAEQYVLMYANKEAMEDDRTPVDPQQGYQKMANLHQETLQALMRGLCSEFLPETATVRQDLKWKDFHFPTGKTAAYFHFGCAFHQVTSQKEGLEDCSLMVSVNSPAANVIEFNHINVVSPVATFQDLVAADYFGEQSSSSPSRYKVYGSQTTSVLVTNYTSVTSLEDYLAILNSAYESDPPTYDRSVCYIMLQVLNGLIYVHDKGCPIRSLGTRDILVVSSNGYEEKYIVINPHCRQRPELSLQSVGKELTKILLKLLHVEVPTFRMKQDLSARIPTRSTYSRSFQRMVQILEGKDISDIILARNLMDFMLWGPTDEDIKLIGCSENRKQGFEVWLTMEQCRAVSRYAIEGLEPLLEEANLMRFLCSATGAMLFEITKCLHK